MTVTSIGDLSRSLVLRNRSAALKQASDRLTAELSSGQVSDPVARLGGDLTALTDMDSNLRRLDGYAIATSEATLFAGAMQTGLGRIQDATSGLGASLAGTMPTDLPVTFDHASLQARSALDATLSALNTRTAGRSLFGGIATDRTAVGDGDTLLTALKGALSGLSTVDDIVQAATAWFDDPSGFAAVTYSGADTSLAPMQVSSDTRISLSLRADDPVFRATLRDLSLAALAGDADLGLNSTGKAELLRTAGEGLLNGQDRLTGLRADLGYAEARLDETAARNAATRTGLDHARQQLLAADPYDTATRLQEVQFQLESLYTVTVRSSQLSLVNFLK